MKKSKNEYTIGCVWVLVGWCECEYVNSIQLRQFRCGGESIKWKIWKIRKPSIARRWFHWESVMANAYITAICGLCASVFELWLSLSSFGVMQALEQAIVSCQIDKIACSITWPLFRTFFDYYNILKLVHHFIIIMCRQEWVLQVADGKRSGPNETISPDTFAFSFDTAMTIFHR